MLFNSFEFIFWFLPLTIVGYALVRHFSTAYIGIAFLALASFVFYLWWDVNNLGILVGAILVNYGFGRFMVQCAHRPGLWQTAKRSALISGLIFNVGLLGYYKYADFFASQVGFDIAHIALPLGISFFTFQKVTYLVDSYLGLLSEAGLIEFSLFVAYFPHAIAGPIVHHRDMMPQFLRPSPPLLAECFRDGLFFLIVGLAKKVLVADTFAPFASDFFRSAASGPVSFFQSWQGVLAYAIQIYFDFSGYSDMAVGSALMMGIRLPFNFNSPYRSTSIIEFWRRWHMTLSRFLKEYIYFPLGGSRRGSLRHYVNLMTVMLIGGFWHGAAWTFLFWGGLHGLYLLINHAWREIIVSHSSHWPLLPLPLRKFLSWAVTFGAVCIAWVFFRVDSVPTAFAVISSMLGFNGLSLDLYRSYLTAIAPRLDGLGIHIIPGFSMTVQLFMYCLVPIAACLKLPNTQFLVERLRHLSWHRSLALGSVLGVLAAVTVCELDRPSEFLYFNF